MSVVWVNGAFDARLDPRDRGLTLGDGVFDTLAAFRRIPFAGARHLARLVGQAAAIGIALDDDRVREGWEAVLGRAEAEDVVLRTTVTRGASGRGLWTEGAAEPTIIVAASPWNSRQVGAPARLVTSTIARNPASPSARLKSLGYLDNVLAAREAAQAGADDALFLTPSGHVACSTIANIFILDGDRLLTPPGEDGVMPGIMRQLVLETAQSLGLRPAERSMAVGDIRRADAVFLTNSVRFIIPVVSLNGEPFGVGADARIAALLAAIAGQVKAECGRGPTG